MDEKRRFQSVKTTNSTFEGFLRPESLTYRPDGEKGSAQAVKTRLQKFCLWCPFLGRVGLRQDKTALKSVKTGRLISLTVETLKSKAVFDTKKVGKNEN